MGAATFGSGTTLSSNGGADLAISSDGQALTLSLAEMEAVVDAGKSPDLVAAFVFSAVVPVDGAGDGVDIAFAVDVFAGVTEGASGDAMLSVNGQTTVQHFSAGTFESFVQQLSFKGGPTKLCHLAVVADVQRDPAYPDAAATLRPLTVDAEIQPSG